MDVTIAPGSLPPTLPQSASEVDLQALLEEEMMRSDDDDEVAVAAAGPPAVVTPALALVMPAAASRPPPPPPPKDCVLRYHEMIRRALIDWGDEVLDAIAAKFPDAPKILAALEEVRGEMIDPMRAVDTAPPTTRE